MRKLALTAAVATLALVSAAEAATITVSLHHGELIWSNGGTYKPEGYPAVGTFNPTNANGGYVFALPDLGGEQIQSVIFKSGPSDSWYQASVLATMPSEVYAMRISSSSDFVGADYGSGTNQTGTKITTGYFTGTIGAMPDVNLTTWVSNTGYTAGNYLLLRTGTSADEATITASGARWWTNSANAQLVITTAPVPEPAMIALLSLTGLVLARRRAS